MTESTTAEILRVLRENVRPSTELCTTVSTELSTVPSSQPRESPALPGRLTGPLEQNYDVAKFGLVVIRPFRTNQECLGFGPA